MDWAIQANVIYTMPCLGGYFVSRMVCSLGLFAMLLRHDREMSTAISVLCKTLAIRAMHFLGRLRMFQSIDGKCTIF